jgi:hypothetical protein
MLSIFTSRFHRVSKSFDVCEKKGQSFPLLSNLLLDSPVPIYHLFSAWNDWLFWDLPDKDDAYYFLHTYINVMTGVLGTLAMYCHL